MANLIIDSWKYSLCCFTLNFSHAKWKVKIKEIDLHIDFELNVFVQLISNEDYVANVNSVDNKIMKNYKWENFRLIFHPDNCPCEANNWLNKWINLMKISITLDFIFYFLLLKIIIELFEEYFQESIMKLAIGTSKMSTKLGLETKL